MCVFMWMYIVSCELGLLTPVSVSATVGSAKVFGGSTTLWKCMLVCLTSMHWYKYGDNNNYLRRADASTFTHVSPEERSSCCIQTPASTKSAANGGRLLSRTDFIVP